MGELFAQWAEALPAAAGAADSPLASVRQRLVWAMAQQPRLGAASVAHKVPHELAGLVAGWLCDTPQTGAVIGAMLAEQMPVEQVRAAGATRLMHLRAQAARCAAGAVHDNDVQSEWARRMGGGGAGLVMYEGITTESGGGQTGDNKSGSGCLEQHMIALSLLTECVWAQASPAPASRATHAPSRTTVWIGRTVSKLRRRRGEPHPVLT